LPGKTPPALEVDISGLEEVGAAIHAGDVKLPDGVELLSDPESIVARLLSSVMPVEVGEEPEELEAVEGAAAAEAAEGEASEGEAGAGEEGGEEE
jgi:large subunit ribosomal protein L25